MAQQRQSINFDDGFKSYEINGDPQRIVRIDTADYGLIERLRNAKNNINEEMKKYENVKIKSDGSADLDDETAADSLRDLGKFICGQFDYIFNSEVFCSAQLHRFQLAAAFRFSSAFSMQFFRL